jgi:hypothetical protein
MLGKDKVLCKTNSVQNKHNLYYKRIFVAYEVLQKVRWHYKNNCIYLIPWISPYAIDQIKCIIQTPNFSDNNWVSDYDGEWNMYIYVLNARTKFCARQILFKTSTTFTTNGSSVAYEVLQKVRWHLTFKQYWFKTKLLCPCQALDLCHNVFTHRTDIEDDGA